ncbi:MAG: acyl-CoA synthetase FdrA, partial [Anaerolineae bacterium]|nr:acyl-CoA synthetase FdrA [Anaerolineae bacterium]
MTITKSEIRAGAYFDSVILMQLQRSLAALPGVEDAGVVMATPANQELLADGDLLTEDGKQAGPDDLLIVVRAKDQGTAANALAQIDELIKKRRSSVSQEFYPRSLDAAIKQLPDANWVLISVPGRYAAGVARQALDQNKNVFLYSDNVSLEDEIDLKHTARDKGLLVMGPDCGTAIINGIGLGFANRVQSGSIGLVGASGTGLQAITSHIHNAGGGISQAIGTGGRDLKLSVGAISASQGLEFLSADPQTEVIVLVSKPPSPQIAANLLTMAQTLGKPVVVDFIGFPPPARQLGSLYFAASLSEAAALAVQIAGQPPKDAIQEKPASQSGKYLRGLFSGGTLAYEALLGLQATLSPIYSNVPITPDQRLEDPLESKAHTIVDLGEDIFTVGRLHPMIDNDLRIRRLRQEAADPQVGLILLDVVLGEGSHPDPAAELAPVISEIKKQRQELEIAALIIGTDQDPQDIDAQSAQLTAAGALIFRSTTAAVAHISARLAGAPPHSSHPIAPEV